MFNEPGEDITEEEETTMDDPDDEFMSEDADY